MVGLIPESLPAIRFFLRPLLLIQGCNTTTQLNLKPREKGETDNRDETELGNWNFAAKIVAFNTSQDPQGNKRSICEEIFMGPLIELNYIHCPDFEGTWPGHQHRRLSPLKLI
jgi:hypothetical protein